MFDMIRSYLRGRSMDYRETFRGEGAQLRVLQDLAKFCRAGQSTFHKDPRVQNVLDGRQEVWIRIQHHLKLSPDELVRIYHPTHKGVEDE